MIWTNLRTDVGNKHFEMNVLQTKIHVEFVSHPHKYTATTFSITYVIENGMDNMLNEGELTPANLLL